MATHVRDMYRDYRQGSRHPDDLTVDVELARKIAQDYEWLDHLRPKAGHAQVLLDYRAPDSGVDHGVGEGHDSRKRRR